MLKLIGLIVVFGCNSNDIQTYRISKTTPSSQPEQHQSSPNKAPTGFSWDTPSSWVESAGHSMRLASFSVPTSQGDGDCSVIQLGGNGGGLEANINRWRGQIGLSAQTSHEIHASAIDGSSKLGKFKMFILINDSRPETAMMASIIELQSKTLFIKLNLHSEAIDEVQSDFTSFCSSFSKSGH